MTARHDRTPGRLRSARTALLACVAALLASGLPAPASADPGRGTDLACPNSAPDAFRDDDGNVHEASIDCMARWEVANGTSAGSYAPDLTVRRDQTAAFVVRLMRTAGFAFDDDPADQFDDDDGNVHEKSIEQLAAAGVVRGRLERSYQPSRTLTRAQMAALLHRALEVMERGPAAVHEHFTDDDGSVFERDIDALASLGVVEGTGDRRYRPATGVTRAAMAAFLARTADHLAGEGSWPTSTGPVASPTDFTAVQGEGAQVLLSWTPPEDIRVDFYFLQIAVSAPDMACEGPRFYGFAEVLDGRATSSHVHDGESGTTYCYRLRAVDQADDGTQQDAPAVLAGPITVR